MLISLALMILLAVSLGAILNKIKIPGLLGLMITGIVLGPFVLDLIDPNILSISAELRRIALVVILLRAGLSLDLNDLKAVGKTALLLSFLPALFEILAITLIAPLIFGISYIEAALMGSVLAAVSPAVIVPKMIMLIEKKAGTKKKIPQMILAAASVDDVFVIVLFTAFLGMYQTNAFNPIDLLLVPVSIILGALVGVLFGYALIILFKRVHMRDTVKVLIVLSMSFILLYLEDISIISGLIGVMSLGMIFNLVYKNLAIRLQLKFSKIWIFAEILLFVLIGAALELSNLGEYWYLILMVLISGLLLRMLGVFFASIKSGLNLKERLFLGLSYMPKATVQAALGAIPLQMGVASGSLILSAAVFSILVTAPIGAFLIELTYKKLLFN